MSAEEFRYFVWRCCQRRARKPIRAQPHLRPTYLVLLPALLLWPFIDGLTAREDLTKYHKVLVQTVGEDATSFFETIYFLDNHNTLVRTIQVWNGGCCQAPLIEEHRRDGVRFEHVRSYAIADKPKSFARYLLCTSNLETAGTEASNAALAGYTAKELLGEMAAEETVAFEGCD